MTFCRAKRSMILSFEDDGQPVMQIVKGDILKVTQPADAQGMLRATHMASGLEELPLHQTDVTFTDQVI